MPSQKQSKRRRQQAKKAPAPPVRSRSRGRRASPRVLIGAAILAVLIVVGIVLGVVLTGGSSSSNSSAPSTGSLTNALPGASDVEQEFKGIPQSGNVLGKPSAPVTMIEYIDLQCPFCQQFETTVMPTIIDKYVRPGKVKVESRLIAIVGPDSQGGREAAVAAGEQNKMFNFSQMLYVNQGAENTGWLDDAMIESAAASIPGLEVQPVVDAGNSSSVSDALAEVDRQKDADRVEHTPTIYVGKSGGKPTEVTDASPTDPAPLEAAIDNALKS
jgi:protein-disulfide isomerase